MPACLECQSQALAPVRKSGCQLAAQETNLRGGPCVCSRLHLSYSSILSKTPHVISKITSEISLHRCDNFQSLHAVLLGQGMVRCHEAPVSLHITPQGSCRCMQLTCPRCCRGVDLNQHLVVCLRRRPLFGNEVSPSSFATMMAGKAALPWEGSHAPALSCIDNADARLLISGLLRFGTQSSGPTATTFG